MKTSVKYKALLADLLELKDSLELCTAKELLKLPAELQILAELSHDTENELKILISLVITKEKTEERVINRIKNDKELI